MPFIRHWPFYVSDQALADRRAALEELERSSGDLQDTVAKVARTERVNAGMRQARYRNGFSEAMEALFSPPRSTEIQHRTRGT